MSGRYAEMLRARMAERARAGGVDQRWYSIRNQAGATGDDERAVVHIYDVIGDSWFSAGVTAGDFVRELATITAPTIELHVNSPGGVIYDGLAIYNALRDHPARVEAIVDGMAASAASWVVQAGDLITMNRFSQMMIHDGMSLMIGNADDLRAEADVLDKLSDNIAGIYAARAGYTVKHWRDAMKAETWYSAEEAVAAGLADDQVTDDAGDQADNYSARAQLVTARARAHNLERV